MRLLLAARIALAVLLPALACADAAGQGYTARPLPAVRAAQPPVVDGRLDDAAWQQAPAAREFVDPITGQPAAEQTEAYLLYDDAALYVAFYCHDTRPESIVAREIEHGASFGGEDSVTFEIDPFYTHSWNTSIFRVNALGTQSEEIASGRAAKQEWRGIWQAAAQRTPDGWTAEMRIPWEVLNYPNGQGLRMGVNFQRSHARPHVDSTWSNLTLSNRPENIGVWQGVTPPARLLRNPWQAMTYVSPAVTDNSGLSAVRAGLDLRYTPTPKMTGVLSLSPDFRNVEQQVASIAFTRSELYLGDSRPFFMEGRWQFEGPLFYSRRIEEFDVGAKMFGNVSDRLTVGALSTLRGARDSASVATLGYALPRGSSLSLATTLRRSPGLEHEGVEGKGYFRFGTWRLLSDMVYAREGHAGGGSLLTALAYMAPHWWVDVHWEQVDPRYSPSLGLRPFVNYRGPLLSASYDSQYRHGPLRSFFINTTLYRFRHYDGSLFQDNRALRLQVETRGDQYLQLYGESSRFEQSRDRFFRVVLGTNISNRFRQMFLSYDWGTRADHRYRYLGVGLTQRLFGGLDVSISGSVLRHFQNREQYVLAVGREFDPRRAFTMRLVEQDGRLNGYLAYRNAGGVGQDIFLILGDPNADRFTRRLALKWVRAL